MLKRIKCCILIFKECFLNSNFFWAVCGSKFLPKEGGYWRTIVGKPDLHSSFFASPQLPFLHVSSSIYSISTILIVHMFWTFPYLNKIHNRIFSSEYKKVCHITVKVSVSASGNHILYLCKRPWVSGDDLVWINFEVTIWTLGWGNWLVMAMEAKNLYNFLVYKNKTKNVSKLWEFSLEYK